MQKEAAQIATDKNGNFNAKVYQSVYGAMMHDASNKIQQNVAQQGTLEFGASSLFGEAYKGIVGGKTGVNQIKSFVRESSFLTASPETQASMLRGLKTRMNSRETSALNHALKAKEAEAAKPRKVPKKANPFGED